MKKFCVFLTALLFLGTTFAVSQPVAGKKFEFGTSLSFSSFKFTDDTESDTLLSLPLRFGYFVWKGLEIEPELMLMKFKGEDTSYSLSGNLSYNFKTAGKLVPFVLAGAGIGNGFAVGPIMEGGSDLNSFLINAGAGVKYVIGTSGAVRIEYRYQHNRTDSDLWLGPEIINLHQFLIGVSLFF